MKLLYEKRLVAFIDILGFTSLIRKSEYDQATLDSIYQALLFLKQNEKPVKWNTRTIEIEEDAQKKGLTKFEIDQITTCTSFSDTIVVSVLCDDDNINERFSTLVANLSFIGAYLFSDGVLVRGGITLGNLIHKDSGTILGKGLIDAYELESKIASFPRIIISDFLRAKLNYPLTKKSDRYPYHQYLVRFNDGCVGFHQMIYFQVLQSWNELTSDDLKIKLRRVKEVIIEGLDNNFMNPNVFGKYAWLKEEYSKLVILEKLKEDIHEPSEATSRSNIHYSYIDKLYYPEPKK